MIILKTRSGQVYGHSDPVNSICHSTTLRYTHTQNLGFLSQIIQEICSGHDYLKTMPEVCQGQGQSDRKIVCDTPPSQDALTYQIWNFYLKEYRRYEPESMLILETRSEVKVTVTQGWYTALCQPKMHAHSIFGIPTSNNTGDMLRTRIF